jgi:hypothetical protein
MPSVVCDLIAGTTTPTIFQRTRSRIIEADDLPMFDEKAMTERLSKVHDKVSGLKNQIKELRFTPQPTRDHAGQATELHAHPDGFVKGAGPGTPEVDRESAARGLPTDSSSDDATRTGRGVSRVQAAAAHTMQGFRAYRCPLPLKLTGKQHRRKPPPSRAPFD